MKNKLKLALYSQGGRNNQGIQTVFTQGGGVKKMYRFIDFKRQLDDYAFVKRIEKDPNRSAFLALLCYTNGAISYVIATEKLQIGSRVFNYNCSDTKIMNNSFTIGNSFKLKDMPVGSLINTLELYPGTGGVLARSAGTWLQIMKRYNKNYIQVKMRSGEQRLIHNDCVATMGIVSNIYSNQMQLRKAGQNRLLGKRPIVRGIAMNPVDHPHGGRTNGGTPPKTPWGALTKGTPTRHNNKTKQFIVVSRRKLKK